MKNTITALNFKYKNGYETFKTIFSDREKHLELTQLC